MKKKLARQHKTRKVVIRLSLFVLTIVAFNGLHAFFGEKVADSATTVAFLLHMTEFVRELKG